MQSKTGKKCLVSNERGILTKIIQRTKKIEQITKRGRSIKFEKGMALVDKKVKFTTIIIISREKDKQVTKSSYTN